MTSLVGYAYGRCSATPEVVGWWHLKGRDLGSGGSWRDVAANDPEGFKEEQHRFIKETHYDIQIERLKSKGLLIEHTRAAVHDLAWSTAVQFGAKTNLIINALRNSDVQNISDKELIITVQNHKKDNTATFFKSSPTWWKDLKDRADSEKKHC